MAQVTGLNHITLAVTELPRSIAFYRDLLGGHLRAGWSDGAYLELGTIWLCLTRADAVDQRTDYTHIAFSSSDYHTLAARIAAQAPLWQDNHSEGGSVYFLDPDGHRLELHDGTLETRLNHYTAHPEKGVTLYD
ncbi:VOC family protein [Alisedimentitalea sp. MJ-SS2]|uniref:VOC family protein n=1 Tax=Aliisedimentitalea sp. MJ-SS2 TaxID=3049795 RepID=UPI00290D7AC6|nr:VOC family protein [Alisedimentitalea sp. MJ-SS2]MDU8926679.1 VOC family protein [Alisedimentitalea sp. MJ-SS2]